MEEVFKFFETDWQTIRHSLILVGLSVAILMVFVFLARQSKSFLSRRLSKSMQDPLLANFLATILKALVILVGLLLIFRIIGLTGVVAGLLTGAGISAFIIGFALKDIGENFLAGILLAFKRPFRIGDVVDINGIRGQILTLNLRDTQIKTVDGKDVFIPNATIVKNPLVNFTIDGFLRYDFIIGLDYGSDYKAAMILILNTVSKVPGVLADQKSPNVWVSDLSESTLNIQATFWVDTFDLKILDVVVKSNVILEVLTALEKGGYNLPARIIELKNHQGKSLKTS
jgi:small conductance mechanosensitive channel